jgi:putative toxin-antitoxin system antitoxin component (TIGR02293 family)
VPTPADERSQFDLARMDALARRLGLTRKELAAGLGMSPRTLRRRQAAGHLQPAEGDRLRRLDGLAILAEKVLGDSDRAHRWIREPQRGLGDRVPLHLLHTRAGARTVEELLGRLEHGVFT